MKEMKSIIQFLVEEDRYIREYNIHVRCRNELLESGMDDHALEHQFEAEEAFNKAREVRDNLREHLMMMYDL